MSGTDVSGDRPRPCLERTCLGTGPGHVWNGPVWGQAPAMTRPAVAEMDRPRLGPVRIIAGAYKGRRFDAPPKGTKTRPTSDFVRETAFNLIGPGRRRRCPRSVRRLGRAGARSALARGRALRVRRLRPIRLPHDRGESREARSDRDGPCQDAPRALASERATFDLVLCDPPYEFHGHDRLAPDLARILSPDGLVVYQTAAATEPELAGLSIRTSRKYGSARLTLFER